jgi:hypothetical protein
MERKVGLPLVSLKRVFTPYQYKREPLTQDEATRLANVCSSHEERLIV